MSKKFIFNADDFGMSEDFNKAVLEGYNDGFLTSASLCANGPSFSAAINDIIPECNSLGIGVHLNIIEGKSLTNCPTLTDKNGVFNKGYLYLILNSYNKDFLSQIENEFRAQIEQIINKVKVDHIDSHVHTHAIPNIFNIVCRLAKEYNIPYVRTQNEKFYLIDNKKKVISVNFAINIVKIILLKFFTFFNNKTLNRYNLNTNKYIIGVGYTGMMDSETIREGLERISEECIVEALIHPCNYRNKQIDSHYTEYLSTIDKNLKDEIIRMGYDVTSYSKL